MAYTPPRKFVTIHVAQVSHETSEAPYLQKVKALEDAANQTCHEVLKSGFLPIPQFAALNNGNLLVFVGVHPDPRAVPAGTSNLAVPQGAMPVILEPNRE